MQTVEVRLWDDLDAKAGSRVPSDEQAFLEYRSPRTHKKVRLDLTTVHGKELDALLAPYLEAGTDPGAAPAARGLKAGSKGARDYFASLREWAASAGRSDEHWTAGRNGEPKQYYYPRRLRNDYEAYLASLAERQAG